MRERKNIPLESEFDIERMYKCSYPNRIQDWFQTGISMIPATVSYAKINPLSPQIEIPSH